MKKKIPVSTAPQFKGFTPAVLEFLHRLAQNNDRQWFAAHKTQFENDVVTPALDLIAAMAAPLAEISPHFLCIPKRVGGSLFRIHRDTRFAHDKRPYKTNLGLHFRHDSNFDVHAPGYYLHIGVDECFLACGAWRPERGAVNRIRHAIVDKPRAWGRARRAVGSTGYFDFHGQMLKRPPPDVPAPPEHPWREDLKRKDFIVLRAFDEGALFGPDLLDFAVETYASATPFMRFLCQSLGARF